MTCDLCKIAAAQAAVSLPLRGPDIGQSSYAHRHSRRTSSIGRSIRMQKLRPCAYGWVAPIHLTRAGPKPGGGRLVSFVLTDHLASRTGASGAQKTLAALIVRESSALSLSQHRSIVLCTGARWLGWHSFVSIHPGQRCWSHERPSRPESDAGFSRLPPLWHAVSNAMPYFVY